MTRRSRFPQILSLSFALLLTGLVACDKDTEDSEAAETTPTQESTPAASTAPGADNSAPAPGQLGALPGAAPSKPADTSKMPDVVAQINGRKITKDELLLQARQMQAQLAQASRGQRVPPLDEAFYKQILDGLVAQTLLLQDAKAQGVAVGDEELKPQLAALRGRFPDEATYKKALEQEGLTEKQLQEKLRQEAVIQKYVGTKILNEAGVTDQAAREFYDKNLDKMQRPERAHLRHILIRVEPTAAAADKQKAKDKAESLLKRIQGGEDFAKLAAENSDDPGSKVRGGDLSWMARGQTGQAGSPFEKAAFALTKPNDLSDVVETQFGYHIIQLVEREAASAVPFEEAKPRITQMLQQRQVGERLQARVADLKKKGKVETFM
ncbi:MAG: peptidyl-prolyl cis-trans isomerase [Acidobacteriota bacterium]|jgi:peptidyl-prolyl cis-trans isomerase C|nr:peptidyl-prolyl cis-trans isomerase [Acidobacteriota bacterium]